MTKEIDKSEIYQSIAGEINELAMKRCVDLELNPDEDVAHVFVGLLANMIWNSGKDIFDKVKVANMITADIICRLIIANKEENDDNLSDNKEKDLV